MTDAAVNDLIPLAEDDGLVRAVSFRFLLSQGRPIEPTEIIAATGLDVSEVMREIDAIHAEGRLTRDSEGRITGSAGLTVVPTSHELVIGDQHLWAWCAVDSVGIMAALEADGVVRSRCLETGALITLTFEAGKLRTSDTVVFVAEAGDSCLVVEEWCPTVNFFENSLAAEAWVKRTNTSGEIHQAVAVADACAGRWRFLIEAANGAQAAVT